MIPVTPTNTFPRSEDCYLMVATLRSRLFIAIVIALCTSIFGSSTAKADEPSTGERLFALKLQNLFVEKCLACHGDDPDDLGGSFDMRNRRLMLVGGDSFESEVLQPSQGRDSMLYRVVARIEDGYEMPPKESEAFTKEEANWVREWIDVGAPWPNDERVKAIQDKYAEGEVVLVSAALSDAWANRRYQPEDLWAYRPISGHTGSEHSISENQKLFYEDQNPIDWFIDQKQKQMTVAPAPAADANALLRRMAFGLTGLPPTKNKTDQFRAQYEADPDAAIGSMARELMDSQHYGEHFGRQWLDVARYADSAGFANDYARPNAWRYRDYVVRAFNQDKPYDEFVQQQIAGDEIDDTDPENLVATGFLRMGPWEQTGMSVFQVTRQQWLDDVVDSVGQTFLAHPLQCAKCHDHKFDPIPTRDYYRMMAVFSTTQFAERQASWIDGENLSGAQKAEKLISAKIGRYQEQRQTLENSVKEKQKAEQGDAKTGDNGLSPGDEASLSRIKKNISRHNWELDQGKPIAISVYTGKMVPRNNVSSRLRMPTNRWKNGMMPNDTILSGGDAFSAGDSVVPGAISAAASLSELPASDIAGGENTRRKDLADWITDRRNPLTARVVVNRIWAWHFGRGIAANPNNFGATGAHPTHPELLDYLANWFMDQGWSIKRLNQLIVSSMAYRRDSRHPDAKLLSERDPSGESYAVFRARRLSAEELRDAMLFCSGELNRDVGGIPCKPDINMEVAMQPRQIMGGTASVYEPDPQPQTRNRRSIYAVRLRGLRDPFLQTFNQPGFDKSCELRESSTVAPQALTLLNATEVHDRALALANQLVNQNNASDDRDVIRDVFRITLARDAEQSELDACLDRWQQATKDEVGKTFKPVDLPTEVTRTVMAEKTGEPYSFIEHMPAYESYVPDLQPNQVDARTRGLANVCLVLLNSNEFAYID